MRTSSGRSWIGGAIGGALFLGGAAACSAPSVSSTSRQEPLAPPQSVTNEASGEEAELADASSGSRSRDLEWEVEANKSYVIPAAEIVSFVLLLNQFDRRVLDEEVYESDWGSFRDNLSSSWVVDRDPFDTNQILHPYAGSIYFGFSRSAGLGFWESLAYTFLGSALWELAGETSPPSANDQVATGIGGAFIGESLFRVASWIVEGEEPGSWREAGAAVVSPPTTFNRYVFGQRFRDVFPSGAPAVFARASLGAAYHLEVSDRTVSDNDVRSVAVTELEIEYGLPGSSGYDYERPFDWFETEIRFTSSPDAYVESAAFRGLLFGGEYESGELRGVAGLYGSYDYLSPELFHLASTALSAGTNAQWRASRSFTLRGAAHVGVGYGAAGTIADAPVDRDYHYGAIPQGLLKLAAIFGDDLLLEARVRDFYVTGAGSDGNGRSENVLRAEAGLTWRLAGRHAIVLEYLASRRDAPDNLASDRHQVVETAQIAWTFLIGNAGESLGAVGGRRSR